MPIDAQELIEQLNVDEPDYHALATLGPDILPTLLDLTLSADPGLASKAVYLASVIDHPERDEVIAAAVQNDSAIVRVQAASVLEKLPQSDRLEPLLTLLDDDDVGVKKYAIRSAARIGNPQLKAKLREIAANDGDSSTRDLASDSLNQ